ncbi:serine/threonine protein kinase [Phycicoccus sp. HDW14]|uniref:serine/threonine-protein kinase n=1 Tax=Phycicoccus sp. HDW14 TaxID=2714941 RepID=UPI0014092BBF|nr:serine/threonine-protein kinase [Phycicoccus sp. HDW14]QIM21634.1 serine/threonine protein kinase [Phycicoccus sp. HDW14]
MSTDDAWRPPEPPTPVVTGPELLPGYDEAVEVARGADSVVFRARQRALGRDVAVKVLQVDDPATAARFARELELTVRLGRLHPHIVTVLDTGATADGRPAIVMEYLERGSLQDTLRASGPLPAADVVRVGKVIADALAFAHGQGVLHRDVKPQNILVLPTSWVLADFGIARLADSGATASVEQFSYRHAAPQVLDGLPPTAADDVWSMGSTLFTLLDGRPPFASDDPADDTALAYLRRVRTEAPRALTRVDLPPGLADVIARCLTKDPALRIGTAEELLHELSRVEGASSSWAPTATGVEPGSAAPVVDVAEPVTNDRSVAAPVPEASAPPAHPAPTTSPAPTEPVATVDEPLTPSLPPGPPPDTAPAPLPAVSALAHTSAEPRDAEPTGTAPAPPAEDPASVVAPAPAPGRPGLLGTPGRRVALGLVAGAAIGVTLVLVLDRPNTPVAQPSRTPIANTVPTTSLDPSISATPVPPVQEPGLRPVIVDARAGGTSVELEWTDPSKGKVTFFVTQVGLPEPKVVAQFPPGTTKGVVEGVDPSASQVCYVVGAFDGSAAATSAQRCLDPSP